jgi:hypothetical protein
MTHLSHDELLALAESDGPIGAARHLAACATCREEVEGLRRALADMRSVEVPEPSPLFWDHFSARVREAIAAGPAPGAEPRPGFPVRWTVALGSLSAAVVAGLLVVGRPPVPLAPSPAGAMTPPVAANPPAGDDATVLSEPAAGEDWDLVVDIAEHADEDDLSQALDALTPGMADDVIPRLSDEEQEALVKLLRAEMEKGRPS